MHLTQTVLRYKDGHDCEWASLPSHDIAICRRDSNDSECAVLAQKSSEAVTCQDKVPAQKDQCSEPTGNQLVAALPSVSESSESAILQASVQHGNEVAPKPIKKVRAAPRLVSAAEMRALEVEAEWKAIRSDSGVDKSRFIERRVLKSFCDQDGRWTDFLGQVGNHPFLCNHSKIKPNMKQRPT